MKFKRKMLYGTVGAAVILGAMLVGMVKSEDAHAGTNSVAPLASRDEAQRQYRVTRLAPARAVSATVKGATYFRPTTWTLPTTPYGNGPRPLSGIPTQTIVTKALKQTTLSTDPVAGQFNIVDGWQLNNGTDVWVGEWSNTYYLGAIVVNRVGVAYDTITVNTAAEAVPCAPGSACVIGAKVVGIEGSKVLVLSWSGQYSVLDVQTGTSYLATYEGQPVAGGL